MASGKKSRSKGAKRVVAGTPKRRSAKGGKHSVRAKSIKRGKRSAKKKDQVALDNFAYGMGFLMP